MLSALLLAACTQQPEAPGQAAAGASHDLPNHAQWTDYGSILEAGVPGEWDHFLWGAFAAGVVKKDDTYFLYYQGASSFRLGFDETTCGRAIGVATSRDGMHFEKYAGNPVLTWAPNDECEEGAVSLALARDENGDILAFYGANTALDRANVNASVRLARSRDGLNFEDLGVVIEHDSDGVWGAGDELFPIAATRADGSWLLYYLPNSRDLSRRLGVAWGAAPDALTASAPVQGAHGEPLAMWGTGSFARTAVHPLTLFLFDSPQDRLRAWAVSPASPQRFVEPLAEYPLADAIHAVVMLDEPTATWFLYYHVGAAYRLRLAPHGAPDASGPAAPVQLTGRRTGATRIELEWAAARDPQTGVAAYRVYRDGGLAGMVTETRFTDPVFEHSEATYRVAAVNLHGVEGPQSEPLTIGAYRPAGGLAP